MADTTAAPARHPVSTRFYTRRVIFACDHAAERIYPIRDLRGPSFSTAAPPVPMLLALRLPEKCIPCARAAVLDRYRGNAKEVRECMSSLHARLDRILNKADSGGDDNAASSDSDATICPPKPRPVGKLSTNIRLLREDLDRRMQAWSRTDKVKAESALALQLSVPDLDEISSYEAFEAEVVDFSVL